MHPLAVMARSAAEPMQCAAVRAHTLELVGAVAHNIRINASGVSLCSMQ